MAAFCFSVDAVAPVVSNIQASQRPGARLVDIYYDLEDSDSAFVTISLLLVDELGQKSVIQNNFLTGDIGDKISIEKNKKSKHIVWDAGEERPNIEGIYRFEITADDHSGDREFLTVNIDNLASDAMPLEMVLIPNNILDYFIMGSPENETGRKYDEGNDKAVLHVTITKDFYLGKYEVTQAQWQAIMDYNPAKVDGVGLNYPVYSISWDECQTFIEKLNNLGQGTFRLPTEAEWEYACRAGRDTRFYWGDDSDYAHIGEYAWYSVNSDNKPHEVHNKEPNLWGLYDMCGNIREWCQDWYKDDCYERYSPNFPTLTENFIEDPKGPNGPENGRVVRGGDYHQEAKFLRSASRDSWNPKSSSKYIGLRLVLEKN